jgi:hypothetical protein
MRGIVCVALALVLAAMPAEEGVSAQSGMTPAAALVSVRGEPAQPGVCSS